MKMVTKDHESDIANNYDDTAYEYYCNKNKDQEEEEDTLSLCDLSCYNDSFKWEEDFSSLENDNNDANEDFFEFFSDDYFTSNPSKNDKANIVFCGKVIPYKGQHPLNDNKSLAPLEKSRINNNNNKVMIKPKWYFYVFGMVKSFPVEYELRDMRTRQSRRWRGKSQPSLSLASSDDNKKLEKTKDKKMSFSSKIKRRSGFWGLIRALRC